MSLTFSVPDSVLSTTLANYRKTLEDNIFTSMPLFYWLIGRYTDTPNSQSESRGKKTTLDGGESIVVPLMYGKNTTAAAYSGYEQLDTTPQEGITAAKFNWKQYSVSIAISGKEEAQNSGEKRLINLLEAKTKQAEMSLQSDMNEDLFSTGTDSSKGFIGLQTLIATTGTVGGIARSGNTWWQANVTSSVGSFAANGLDKMRTLYNTVSKGNDHPDLILTDQTDFERYEKLLQPQERFSDAKVLDGGFENCKFKGAVMTYDASCPSGYLYMLNSKYLGLTVHSTRDFATTDFVKPENQDARVAQILFMGEFTVSNCARQGVLTGLTA